MNYHTDSKLELDCKMPNQSISRSTPLAVSTSTKGVKKQRSPEEELEFYTQSLIDNMNSPPVRNLEIVNIRKKSFQIAFS